MKTTALFALIGAASALVARAPRSLAGAAFEAPNSLIQYQRWCPVCETVALNQACIAKRASCQASTLVVPDDAPECSERCSNTCQLSPVSNSDFGYSCNVTMPATGAN